MKKIRISVACMLMAGVSMLFSSCIGSFNLTKSVLVWNENVGSKVINEVIFFAFWLLPVYEVSALADLLVLNSIEFWRGKNPVEVVVPEKTVDTEQGRYIIKEDNTGYTIIHEPTGRETRLDFDVDAQTWYVKSNVESIPLMTYVDSDHVRMMTPDGGFTTVELTRAGAMAYYEECLKMGREDSLAENIAK